MNSLKTKDENPKGLHQRFVIRKIVGWRTIRTFPENEFVAITQAVDKNAEYFVMRLDEGGKDREHIKACRIGVHAYADAIEATIPELAKDLRERYPKL